MKVVLLLALSVAITITGASQSRDYLSDEEIELVRDAQQIDKRIDVLVHAVDRRFAALNVNVSAPLLKEGSEWGALPTGTRRQLLFDIKRILQKATEDIDNLSTRPTSMVVDEPEKGKKAKGFDDVFPVAVRKLGEAASRYKIPLKRELDTAGDGAEKGSILDSLEMCEEIVAAVAKLPPEVKKTKK
jgi:hypothetical protein